MPHCYRDGAVGRDTVSKVLDCPIDSCHASIEGETEDEILAQAGEHAAE
jgi:hypothetical protein